MKFICFVSMWIALMVTIALLLSYAPTLFTQQNITDIASSQGNHFSVRWMGFLPSYNNQYPDYVVCINNLAEDNWTMGIGFQIKNQEDKGYYFQIGPNATPPTGWTVPTVNLGFINIDQTLVFTYNAYRLKITSIAEGKLVQYVPLVVKAYHDSALTQLYSQDSFNITFIFLDYTAPGWSVLYNDNFDDGTTNGWTYISSSYLFGTSNDYYRSYPYSLKASSYSNYDNGFRKSFSIPAGYSEAYLIFSVKSQQYSSQGLRIYYGGTQYFGTGLMLPTDTWLQFATLIPVGQTTQVNIYCAYGSYKNAYLDDVYIIAK